MLLEMAAETRLLPVVAVPDHSRVRHDGFGAQAAYSMARVPVLRTYLRSRSQAAVLVPGLQDRHHDRFLGGRVGFPAQAVQGGARYGSDSAVARFARASVCAGGGASRRLEGVTRHPFQVGVCKRAVSRCKRSEVLAATVQVSRHWLRRPLSITPTPWKGGICLLPRHRLYSPDFWRHGNLTVMDSWEQDRRYSPRRQRRKVRLNFVGFVLSKRSLCRGGRYCFS